jgi:hypothetical protein
VSERKGRRWTCEELDRVSFLWGVVDVQEIAKRLNRTVAGVAEKVDRLGLGSPGRGYETLKQFSERTGFAEDTIRCAAKKAGIVIPRRARGRNSTARRSAKGRHYAIDDDLAERLLAVLDPVRGARPVNEGAWGTKGRRFVIPPACLGCGRTDRKHYARGYDRACYSRLQKAGQLPRHDPT